MKQLNFIIICRNYRDVSLTGGVSAAQQITISNVVMDRRRYGTATVVMNSAPTGLAGFKIGSRYHESCGR